MTTIVKSAAELAAALAAAPASLPLATDPLDALPAPTLVAKIDFEAELTARLTDYAERVEAAGLQRPDILSLETTPEAVLMQAHVYGLTVMEARLNSAYRGGLLYFAAPPRPRRSTPAAGRAAGRRRGSSAPAEIDPQQRRYDCAARTRPFRAAEPRAPVDVFALAAAALGRRHVITRWRNGPECGNHTFWLNAAASEER